MSHDCIFCKILAKDIPSYTIWENNDTLAFLDISPLAKGHTVVIPKEHAPTVLESDDIVLGALLPAVKQVMRRLREVLHPDGFTIGINHGAVSGQTVPHLHIHVIPRWEGDGGEGVHGIISNPGNLSVEDVAALFQ